MVRPLRAAWMGLFVFVEDIHFLRILHIIVLSLEQRVHHVQTMYRVARINAVVVFLGK